MVGKTKLVCFFFPQYNLLYCVVYTGPSSARKTKEAAAPKITWQGKPSGRSPAAEIASIATGMTTI